MNLIDKIGLTIGMQMFLHKYHIVRWIDGEYKNPSRFFVAVNLIPYPANMKEESVVKEWVPKINGYELSSVTISVENYLGYM